MLFNTHVPRRASLTWPSLNLNMQNKLNSNDEFDDEDAYGVNISF
jgi:hypothetical protein